MTNTPIAVMEEVRFSSSQIGWICGGIDKNLTGDPVLLKTMDGGKTWRSINLRSLQVSKFRTFYPVNDSVLYASGPDQSTGSASSLRALYTSRDGGNTWRKLVSPTFANGSYGLYFFNERVGVSVNINAIQKTINGGQTWRTVLDGGLVGLDKVQCFGTGVGYAVGSSGGYDGAVSIGTLLKTTDQGETWQSLPWPNGGITTLSFLNDRLGFVGTLDRHLYKTVDGGASWQTVDGVTPSASRGIFLSETEGYFPGLDIESTHDGGHTWQAEHTFSAPGDACGLGFSPAGTGIAFTNSGFILRN